MRNAIALLAGTIALLTSLPYAIDVVKGRTKPHVVSWFTWSLLLIVATSATFAAHQNRSALLLLGDTVGTCVVLVLGVIYGIAKYTWFDGLCQLGAILGFILWIVFNSPAIALAASVCIDLIASIPTIKHSWESPQEETWQTFSLTVFASALTIISLSEFKFTSLFFPAYLLLANLTLVIVVVYRRNKLGISLSRGGTKDSIH